MDEIDQLPYGGGNLASYSVTSNGSEKGGVGKVGGSRKAGRLVRAYLLQNTGEEKKDVHRKKKQKRRGPFADDLEQQQGRKKKKVSDKREARWGESLSCEEKFSYQWRRDTAKRERKKGGASPTLLPVPLILESGKRREPKKILPDGRTSAEGRIF